RATFDSDRVDVVVGGLELARAFTRVRWDHLLYTGSPAIGREIAKAAAEQLVPVTLELGGKCPAILTADSVDAESVKQVLGISTRRSATSTPASGRSRCTCSPRTRPSPTSSCAARPRAARA